MAAKKKNAASQRRLLLPPQETLRVKNSRLKREGGVAQSPFLEDMTGTPSFINHYNSAEVKHGALDDALRRTIKFVEDHSHTDRKLFMGYAACLFAVGATVYSHFVPYPECRLVLIISVISYFPSQRCHVFLRRQGGERGDILLEARKDSVGLDPDQKVVVSSRNKRFTPDYSLSIQLRIEGGKGKKGKGISAALVVEECWVAGFDVEGEPCCRHFPQGYRRVAEARRTQARLRPLLLHTH
ncbi:microsomal signal peptidase 25 kDa subunit-domain-containing protein [Chytridium lagenaria]|nr:microsomal signal peptidase 25 kDa subunit-domain-containing protein [Chytridium lagenaria]